MHGLIHCRLGFRVYSYVRSPQPAGAQSHLSADGLFLMYKAGGKGVKQTPTTLKTSTPKS